MASYVQVSNLDFQDIKTALKEYLRAQSDFTSYDFEGSSMSVLLDILAYNTYYTAFNTNMVVNEMFLDSATLRDNVISLAKQLGYRPKSKVAPMAEVTFTASYPGTAPKVAVLQKGTGFTTVFNDTLYSYVTIEDQSVPVENGVGYFDDVPIYEGTLITSTFVVNTALPSQRFIIQNPGVDTNSVRVKVYESQQSTSYEVYDYAENILNVDYRSTSFFLDEIEDERYELFFGDGVLGKKLENGNKIEVSYLVTNGPETNGAKSFTFNGVVTDKFSNIGYVYNIAVDSASTVAANGGADIESLSKIKYNAPKFFSTQDRAVTATDYSSIVRKIYPAISDIIIFGGEEDAPEYGKVKIVVKPEQASFLSSTTKKQIVEQMKRYMVASVIPEIIDPSILYIEANTSIYYSTAITTQKPEDIKNKVISGINNYLSQSDVEKFNGKFRFSKFVSTIDNSDRAIASNKTEIMLRKDFFPQINSTTFYEVCFQNEFYQDCDGPSLVSSGFKVTEFPSYTVYFEDRDGVIALYRLDSLTSEKITLNDSIGTVDYVKGEVKLYDVTIIKGSFSDNRIEIRVKPKSNDINAFRELFLDVDVTQSKFTVYPE